MSKKNQENKPEFDKEIYKTLKTADLLFPETPSEVEQIEQELKEYLIKLPESISDASMAFDLICNSSNSEPPKMKPNISMNNDTRNSLARAAREGGDISEELAEHMRKDRKKARDEMNGK